MMFHKTAIHALGYMNYKNKNQYLSTSLDNEIINIWNYLGLVSDSVITDFSVQKTLKLAPNPP